MQRTEKKSLEKFKDMRTGYSPAPRHIRRHFERRPIPLLWPAKEEIPDFLVKWKRLCMVQTVVNQYSFTLLRRANELKTKFRKSWKEDSILQIDGRQDFANQSHLKYNLNHQSWCSGMQKDERKCFQKSDATVNWHLRLIWSKAFPSPWRRSGQIRELDGLVL